MLGLSSDNAGCRMTMSISVQEPSLDAELRSILLRVARDSIQHGLHHGQPLPLDAEDFPRQLRPHRATFVTLQRQGVLRGCIGHLEPLQPLVVDVAENAFAAAFRDPRFPPLREAESTDLELHISILSPATRLEFSSEQDLIGQLQPGSDGLILEDGSARGTFLPSVWEALPEPKDFFTQLKRKAGLSPSHWSPTLKVYRYRTQSFS